MSLPQVTGYICRTCGWTDFHPVKLCPRCNGEVTQTILPGKGRIVTYTEIRYPPKGFENQAPYVVAIIDIENGPRVIARISNSIREVKVGSMVTLASSKESPLEFRLST